ncbi:MAG TPA: hypothetical protein VKM93_08235 [Terriglobia bacterium]|nr:hypothetical protein [Terriglobia bacterium]
MKRTVLVGPGSAGVPPALARSLERDRQWSESRRKDREERAGRPRSQLLVLAAACLSIGTAFAASTWSWATVAGAQTSKRAALSDEEEDKLREEQDPAKRIELYLAFAQDRLSQFEIFRQKPDDPQYNTGKYLDEMMGQYIALDDELKDWIDNQYDRGGDMRAGLTKLVQVGPQQLEQLRHIQQVSDPRSSVYGHSVQDAIDDLTDTIDGGTKALAEQIKKFGQLKKNEKADARAEKERTKEAEKREKEEKKLQKKEQKQNKVPTDADQEN